jgi:hypothetical protein
MAILIIGIFALAIALEATGHVVFRGRLISSKDRPVWMTFHRDL